MGLTGAFAWRAWATALPTAHGSSAIRTIARAGGKKNVGPVELNRVLAGKGKLVTEKDGVHPNAAGYKAIAEALAPHVRRAWLRPGGDGYIMFGTRRTAEQIAAAYAKIPPVKYDPPRWPHSIPTSRTRRCTQGRCSRPPPTATCRAAAGWSAEGASAILCSICSCPCGPV